MKRMDAKYLRTIKQMIRMIKTLKLEQRHWEQESARIVSKQLTSQAAAMLEEGRARVLSLASKRLATLAIAAISPKMN